MQFKFDPQKTLQAVGVVLHSHGKQMGTMRLLKILYIADRELLAQTGRTLTGDRPLAMKYGPVLGKTYDYLKQEAPGFAEWQTLVQRDGFRLTLTGEPGLGRLTKREVAKLHEICARYHDIEDWDLSDLTHHFGEWASAFDKTKPNGSAPILWELALIDQNCEGMTAQANRELEVQRALDGVLGANR